MSEDRTEVEFPPFEQAWCRPHRYPLGSPPEPALAVFAMYELMAAVLQVEEIVRACGGDLDAGIEADANQLTGALAEFSPLCCLLDPKALEGVIFRARKRHDQAKRHIEANRRLLDHRKPKDFDGTCGTCGKPAGNPTIAVDADDIPHHPPGKRFTRSTYMCEDGHATIVLNVRPLTAEEQAQQ